MKLQRNNKIQIQKLKFVQIIKKKKNIGNEDLNHIQKKLLQH